MATETVNDYLGDPGQIAEALDRSEDPGPTLRPPLDPAPPRRYLAPDVVALWPEDRPPVVNPPRRGRLPRGVERLRTWDRLHAGDYAYIWGTSAHNRGLMVKLIQRYADGDWEIEGFTGLIEDVKRVLVERAAARPDQLRRCPAPKGVRHG